MDSLSKKLSNLGLHDIRNAARFAQNVIVQYEPYQVDIRRATNTDSWGPTPKHLAKVMRHSYEVSMFLITEYTLKRLVDHMAKKPKNMYEKARKQYVNYGNEWRVVLKSLVLLEYLLLNSERGKDTDQVLSCLQAHKHILTRETMQYHVEFSSDGKMELHERGIRKKCENLIQLMDDAQYLKRERAKHAENKRKIVTGSASSRYEGLYNDNSITADSITSASAYDDSDDFEYTPNTHRDRRSSVVDEQRRQRREMLRERIRTSEHQRKASNQGPEMDLLDFDDTPAAQQFNQSSSAFDANFLEQDDEDDDFGDFQSEKSPAQTPQPTLKPAASSTLNDLLDFGGSSTSTTHTTANTNTNANMTKSNTNDAFADLFFQSKNQI